MQNSFLSALLFYISWMLENISSLSTRQIRCSGALEAIVDWAKCFYEFLKLPFSFSLSLISIYLSMHILLLISTFWENISCDIVQRFAIRQCSIQILSRIVGNCHTCWIRMHESLSQKRNNARFHRLKYFLVPQAR